MPAADGCLVVAWLQIAGRCYKCQSTLRPAICSSAAATLVHVSNLTMAQTSVADDAAYQEMLCATRSENFKLTRRNLVLAFSVACKLEMLALQSTLPADDMAGGALSLRDVQPSEHMNTTLTNILMRTVYSDGCLQLVLESYAEAVTKACADTRPAPRACALHFYHSFFEVLLRATGTVFGTCSSACWLSSVVAALQSLLNLDVPGTQSLRCHSLALPHANAASSIGSYLLSPQLRRKCFAAFKYLCLEERYCSELPTCAVTLQSALERLELYCLAVVGPQLATLQQCLSKELPADSPHITEKLVGSQLGQSPALPLLERLCCIANSHSMPYIAVHPIIVACVCKLSAKVFHSVTSCTIANVRRWPKPHLAEMVQAMDVLALEVPIDVLLHRA